MFARARQPDCRFSTCVAMTHRAMAWRPPRRRISFLSHGESQSKVFKPSLGSTRQAKVHDPPSAFLASDVGEGHDGESGGHVVGAVDY